MNQWRRGFVALTHHSRPLGTPAISHSLRATNQIDATCVLGRCEVHSHPLPYSPYRAPFTVRGCVSAVARTTPGGAERARSPSVSMRKLKGSGRYEASATVYEGSKSAIEADLMLNIWNCSTQCFILKISQWSFATSVQCKDRQRGKSTLVTLAYFQLK